jgi:hypothetical protein
MCFKIDLDMDEDSFNLLFKEICPEKEILTENEICIRNYKFNSEKHLAKHGLIVYLILRIQLIIRHKLNDVDIMLNQVLSKYQLGLFKIQIMNNLTDVDLWIINYEQNFKWEIDYYTLKKVELSDNSYYINKTMILDENDYINIIGSDPKDSFLLMNEREKIITSYLLLNSIKLRNIMAKSNFIP